MPNSKPHVHKRSSSGEATCGRGGAHPKLTAYTDEVTCMYCALGVSGHPLPASGRDLGPDEFIGDNGDLMTREEAIAIGQLQRLARHWPKTLKLVSMDGELHVIHSADERFHDPSNIVRIEAILAHITGIPNDGGGW
jgi:hypothetical protein